MSVRRLAEVQPETFAFSNENMIWADRQIAKYPEGRQASAVLSLLWRAQKQNAYWLPKPAIEEVARMLGMPYIRVLEVATFYTMFNLAPVGRFFIQMCGTTPCMLAGSDSIKQVLATRIGPQSTVSADGTFSWLEVECLGACCNAPMVQINDDYYEDLNPKNFNELLDDLAAGKPVTIGSQIGRRTSEPVGGLTSLTSLYGVDGWHGKDSGIHHGSVHGNPPPHSGQSFDTRTMGPSPTHEAATRRTERSDHSIATPDQTVDTGNRRTEAAVSLDGHNREKMTQAEAKNAPSDAPSVPPGREPKSKD